MQIFFLLVDHWTILLLHLFSILALFSSDCRVLLDLMPLKGRYSSYSLSSHVMYFHKNGTNEKLEFPLGSVKFFFANTVCSDSSITGTEVA